MLKAVSKPFVPNKIVILHPTEQKDADIVRIAAFTKNQLKVGGRATAYICQNYSCRQPTTDINKMLELLDVKS